MPAATLHIFIGETQFHDEMDINLPDNNIDLSWEENVEVRELYLFQMKQRMRILYYKQIIKCQHQYYYVISCQSNILTNHSERQLNASKYLLHSA